MKKRHVLLLIAFLVLFQGPLFGSGQKDKSIIVPANTVAFIRIDVQKNLAAGISPVILDLLTASHDRGLQKKPGRTVLDGQLKEIFGAGLEDIETVTMSLLSYNIKEQPFPYAVHMKLKQGVSKKVLQHNKDTSPLDANTYRGKTYLTTQPPGRKTCLYFAGDDFFFTNDPSIMENMLDILHGSGSVQGNQALYTLIKQYKDNPFYCAGNVPAGTDSPIPYPFEQVKEFGIAITLEKEISFLAKVRAGSAESAGELITAMKGNLSLFGMVMLARNKKAYPVLAALIQGIEYEQKDSYALISGRYTEKDIKNLIDLVPILLMMAK